MQLLEVNNTKQERISDQDTCSFFQLLPSQWNFHGRFGPLSTSTKTTMVKRNSDLFLLFSKTESIRRRREIALNGIHSRRPFTTLCYASRSWMNCEAQQAQKSLFGTWWDNRTNLVKWFFFSIGISDVTSVATTARALRVKWRDNICCNLCHLLNHRSTSICEIVEHLLPSPSFPSSYLWCLNWMEKSEMARNASSQPFKETINIFTSFWTEVPITRIHWNLTFFSLLLIGLVIFPIAWHE